MSKMPYKVSYCNNIPLQIRPSRLSKYKKLVGIIAKIPKGKFLVVDSGNKHENRLVYSALYQYFEDDFVFLRNNKVVFKWGAQKRKLNQGGEKKDE